MGDPSNHLRKSTCSQNHSPTSNGLGIVPIAIAVRSQPPSLDDRLCHTHRESRKEWRGSDDAGHQVQMDKARWKSMDMPFGGLGNIHFEVFPCVSSLQKILDPIFMNKWPIPGSVMLFSSICVHPALPCFFARNTSTATRLSQNLWSVRRTWVSEQQNYGMRYPP